jgi:heme oxygenase
VEVLREATERAQHALESTWLHQQVRSNDVTLLDYRHFLQAQLTVFVPWVECLPAALREASGCDPAARLDALHLDLAALHDDVIDEPARASFSFDWPPASAEWWGALYVMEASRLDGRTTARHLREQLGLCVAGALRFLDPPNDAAQPAWATLLHRLEAAVDESAREEAVAGALVTFAHFHAAFAIAAPPPSIDRNDGSFEIALR